MVGVFWNMSSQSSVDRW